MNATKIIVRASHFDDLSFGDCKNACAWCPLESAAGGEVAERGQNCDACGFVHDEAPEFERVG
jgi:hypothetical protein